jgi:hypothetical protein
MITTPGITYRMFQALANQKKLIYKLFQLLKLKFQF